MTSTVRALLLATVSGVLWSPAPVQAQFVAGASVVGSWQPEGEISYVGDPRPSPGVGGSAVGIGMFAGGLITPRFGVRVEVSVPSSFDGLLDDGVVRTRLTHRDVVVSPVVSFKPSARGPELIGGFALIAEQTDETFQIRDHAGVFRNGTPAEKRRHTWSLTGGIDFPIPLVKSKVFLTPQLRVHWISRQGQGDGTDGISGLSAIVLRPAFAVTVQL